MPQVPTSAAQLARDGVLTILRDPVFGFNAQIAILADAYNLDAFALDLDNESGPEFFVGQYELQQLLDSDEVTIDPAVLVVFAGSRQNNVGIQQKNCLFAGTVTVDLETHISWAKTHPVGSEPWIDMIEAAMFYMFNRRGVTWPLGVGYNGDISVDPGPIQYGVLNWQVVVRTRLSMSVRIP